MGLREVVYIVKNSNEHWQSKRIPENLRNIGQQANADRFDRVRDGIIKGVGGTILTLGLGAITTINFDNIKDAFLPSSSPDQRLRTELSKLPSGLQLLGNIDPKLNPSRDPIEFSKFASQIEATSKACLVPIKILPENQFSVTSSSNNNPSTDKLNQPPIVRAVYGLTDIQDIKHAIKQLQILAISCRLTQSQIPKDLRPVLIQLVAGLSKELTADPRNPETSGVDATGTYTPNSNQINLQLGQNPNSGSIDLGLFPHELAHAAAGNSTRGQDQRGDDSIQREILTDEIFDQWEKEDFGGENDISDELKLKLVLMGLRPYTINASRFTKNYKNIKAGIAIATANFDKISGDINLINDKILLYERQIKAIDPVLNPINAKIETEKFTQLIKELTDRQNDFRIERKNYQEYIQNSRIRLVESKKLILYSPEVISTSFEALFGLDDQIYNLPATQAMLDRTIGSMYAITKSVTFSPNNRSQYKGIVREVRTLVNQEKFDEANKIIDQNSIFIGAGKVFSTN